MRRPLPHRDKGPGLSLREKAFAIGWISIGEVRSDWAHPRQASSDSFSDAGRLGSIRKIITGTGRSAAEGLWRIEWPEARAQGINSETCSQERGNTKKMNPM